MSFACVHTAQGNVTTGQVVSIEADLSRGLHSFSLVGLAGKAVEEAKDRVNSAIKNSGYKAPKSQNHKLTVSLAPADIKKDGPLFDLPIAIAYLLAKEEISVDNTKRMYIGELSLDGSLKPIRGVLSIAKTAKDNGYQEIILPTNNTDEAALVTDIDIIGANNLKEVIAHIDKSKSDHIKIEPRPATVIEDTWQETAIKFEDIKGQESAKRGLLIAAAGRHNVLMVGPPGTGKTMLARAFQSILPPLNRNESLDVTSIHSYAGELGQVSSMPPFRAPHHTASHTALVGGGTNPRPGEITLAHNGVLFLDEFPEFERRSIDALRQPLEDRVVSISRVSGSAIFPADFILVAAMNPYRGSEDGTTDFVASMMDTYRNKISGPILDRIDLWLEVTHVDYDTLSNQTTNQNETTVAREKVITARQAASARLGDRGINTNGQMSARDLDELVTLNDEVQSLLKQSSASLNLSPRSYHRLLKVARTIADLEGSADIETQHLLEALQYRVKL